MKVAVAGSRDFHPLSKVALWIEKNLNPDEDILVTGGARGPDRVAEETFTNMGGSCIIHYAKWEQGRGAGMSRNTLIVADADRLVAFWDGQSRGTADSVRKGRDRGIPVIIIPPDKEAE